MMLKSLMKTAALALMVAAAPMAQAQSATAHFSGFSYVLNDLDLDDGITPELTLSNESTYVYGSIYSLPTFDYVDRTYTFGVGEVSISNEQGVASASHDGMAATSTVQVYGGGNYFFGSASQSWQFVLTPNSEAVFSGFAAASGTNDGSLSADGHSTLHAHYAIPGAASSSYFFDSVFAFNGFDARELTLAIGSGAEQLVGAIGYAARTSGSIAAVPEPETYAMLLAGLALVGGLSRRHLRVKELT